MKILILPLILVVCLLGACTSEPYAELSFGHIVSQTDYVSLPSYEKNRCDTSFRGELGVEKKVTDRLRLQLKYSHNSNIDCGKPVDDFNEFVKNAIEVGIRIN